jgi:tryptophanyl-tRNA synthetase
MIQHPVILIVDWLAAGINPNTSTIFVQSKVPEHAELHLLLSMITPLPWLERVLFTHFSNGSFGFFFKISLSSIHIIKTPCHFARQFNMCHLVFAYRH